MRADSGDVAHWLLNFAGAKVEQSIVRRTALTVIIIMSVLKTFHLIFLFEL